MGRRRFPRTDIDQPASFLVKQRQHDGCLIRNFSQGGLYLTWGESDLASDLTPGFFSPEQRERARLEVVHGHLSAEVEIVYVNQMGCGLAFVESGEALLDYLQSLNQGLSDIPQSQEAGISRADAKTIMQRLHQRAVNFLEKSFKQFNSLVRDDLIAAADESSVSGEQGDLFFAVSTLEREQSEIRDAFFQDVQSRFTSLTEDQKKAQTQVRSAASEKGSELELVEKEEFDVWMLLDGIAHRVEAQSAGQVYQLNYALSHLFQRPIKNEANPLSPLALLLALQTALVEYPFIPKAKKLIYQSFGRGALGNIQRLYGDVIASLEKDGIKTHSPEQDRTGSQQGTTPVQLSQPAGQGNLENLGNLLDRSQAKYTPEEEPDPDAPEASREQVLESMESLSKRGEMILNQLEDFLDRQEKGLKIDPATRATINASEKLVTAVQRDEWLNDGFQELVNQLEIPLIKENLYDPGILDNPQHPGRRFLEAVESLAPYLSGAGVQNLKHGSGKARLQHLIDQVESGDLRDISDVTVQIKTLHDEQKAGFERNCELAVESCTRQERHWQALNQVKQILNKLILGKSISSAVDKLFEYGWANLLIQTQVLHGQESVEWEAYLAVVDLLQKLFRQDRPAKRLSQANAQDIVRIVRRGFKDYPVYPEGTRKFAKQLQQALVEGGEKAANFMTQRISVDEAYINRLFIGHQNPTETVQQAIEPQWLELVAGLDVGDWVIQQNRGKRLRLVNLAWKSPVSDKHLLVDGNGIKVLYADSAKLAGLFRDNHLAMLENHGLPVVDRAVQRILQNNYDSVQQAASYDELTGLLNRRAFERLIQELLEIEDQHHAIILLDVDQFGLVNDLCGFEGGDNLLCSIADILRTYLPDSAQLARTGDDEFSILTPLESLDQGFQLAEQHREAIAAFRYNWKGQVIPVSASVGVVSVDSRQQTTAELMKSVSSACTIAKQEGRNCTRIYRATDQAFLKHRQLIDSLAVIEDALENDKIILVAQAIIPLQEDAATTHYEILLRVVGDQGELQSPVHFILAAERYNFMRSVDRWVVERFFEMVEAQKHLIQQTGGFSINLSSQSLTDSDFKRYLIERIEASSIPREKLGFELTETAMISDSLEAVNFIREIKATGCSFYLDDFGSGYASFSYLKEMPVDFVKIDGIFIRDLLQDEASREMVKAVTGISHFMGKRVVAEFVENQETADELRRIGVDFIQGYHVGRPTALADILEPDAARLAL